MIQPLAHNELMVMREAGKVAADVLRSLKKVIKAGISTKDIETFFDRRLDKYPAMTAAFKGYSGYPASVCVSLNDEVIHGIPSSERLIEDGDIVSVDLGIKYKGLFVDTACTYAVGKVPALAKKLIKATESALAVGIKKAKIGLKVGDISSSIQKSIERKGFSAVRQFVGHGIGRELHLPPEVPNFGEPGSGEELKEGRVIAIEPMVTVGGYEVEVLADGWTAKTKDGSLSAHIEHTVAITKKGPLVITQ
ncbi:MAG: type I methionyl aminopeptidase [Candidatus Omnitrophica bacterium]|nr:type I methionyl aminopeptidase [Candidatus Omnitrophota bacterium]